MSGPERPFPKMRPFEKLFFIFSCVRRRISIDRRRSDDITA